MGRAGTLGSSARRGLPVLLVAGAVVALDQLTKYLVRANMELGESIPSGWPVGLTYTTNTGGAFGLFSNQTFLLAAAALLAVAVVVLSLRYLPPGSTLLKVGLGLDLGGAVGNLIDRLVFGKVTDFIDVRVWPIFNVADASIVVGTFLIVVYLLFATGKKARAG